MKKTPKVKKQAEPVSRTRGRKPRKAETWQDQLIRNSINGIFLYRPWYFILVNEPFSFITGYSWPELKTMNPLDLIAPQQREKVQARVEQRLKGKKDEGPYEAEIVRKDGEVRQVVIQGTAVDYEGAPAVLGNLTDVTELRRAENALAESEANFRALAESASDGILITADNGRFLYANRTAADMLGYGVSELIGMHYRKVVRPETIPEIQENHQRVLKNQPFAHRYETRFIRADGAEIQVGLSVARTSWVGAPATLALVRDIGERKERERKLRESEARYRGLVEQIPAVAYVSGAEKEVTTTYLGPRTLDMLGYSAGEYEAGRDPWHGRVLPEDRERVLAELKRCRMTEEPMCVEYRMIGGKGEIVWIREHAHIVRDRLGKAVCLQGLMLDITDEVRRRETLENEKRDLESIVGERTEGLRAANRQLSTEMEQRRQALELIEKQRELALKLSATRSLEEGLRLSLESAIAVSGMDSGGIYLAEESSGDLVLKVHAGLSAEFVDAVERYPQDSARARIVRERLPIFTRSEEVEADRNETERREGLKALGVVALKDDGEVIGCLNVASHRMDEFPELARPTLETIAAQIAASLSRLKSGEELRRHERELEIANMKYGELNTALKVMLERREEDRRDFEDKVLTNVKELVLPYAAKLKEGELDTRSMAYAEILEENLTNIVSPFHRRLSGAYKGLTPREIEILSFIKQGRSSKDIAEIMGTSRRTIEAHRFNIRKKLGLLQKRVNLRTHLLSIH